jgi:isopenicillin N synthase-like dioxygenase
MPVNVSVNCVFRPFRAGDGSRNLPPVQIPLIDLAPWFTGDDDARRAIAEEVDRHLQALGFLVVVNHGIDQSVFDDARGAIRQFKDLPLEVKEQYRQRGEGYRGWVGVGEESNAGAYGVDAPPDLKETYAVGTPDVPDELRARAPRWFAPNVYPDAEVPTFRPSVDRFIHEARNLVDELLDLLSLALGMPQDTMRSYCTTPSLSASFNWYLPRAALAPPPADDPDEELISLVLFHDPDFDALIEPLAGCCGPDNPPRYEPVVAGEHLARMMDALSVADKTEQPD